MTGFSSAPVMKDPRLGPLAARAPRWSDSYVSPAQQPRPVPVKMATCSAGELGHALALLRIF
jgi:hypothetical protein